MSARKNLKLLVPVLSALVLALVVSASAAGVAAAATRYASPNPLDPSNGTCLVSNPCDFATAINQAADGDEVIVEAGTYPSNLGVDDPPSKQLYIHGEDGKPAPVISSSAPIELAIEDPRSRVSRLRLENTSGSGTALSFGGSIAEQVVAIGAGNVGTCELSAGTLRDTVCVATATAGAGLRFDGATAPAALRNVTAVALGSAGLGLDAGPSGTTVGTELDVTNSIFRGAASDIFADSRNLSFVVGAFALRIRSSNYASSASTDESNASVFDLGGHQTVAPKFVDAAGFDFREAPGSPTIGAGVTDAANGPLDVNGAPRVTAAGVTDIGATQAVPTVTPPGGGGVGKPPIDRTAPAFSKSSFAHRSFAVVPSRGHKRLHGVRYGASVRFTVSEGASVRGVVSVKTAGRVSGKRCVKATSGNRKAKACMRWVTVGTAFTKQVKVGASTVAFSGRFGHHVLKPGSYRLALAATDATHNHSRVKTIDFRIVKG